MNDGQIDELLTELRETRKSFENVVKTIKWNRINTFIQYVLIVIVLVIGGGLIVNYQNYKRESCEQTNITRITVVEGMRLNAFAIGSALQSVFQASDDRFQQYLDAYNAQRADQEIPLREC